MLVDDPYIVRMEAIYTLGDMGKAFRELTEAWMPKSEMPSMRDLFAAFALMGHIACPESEVAPDFVAEFAYGIADAMMKWKKENAGENSLGK